MDVHSDNTDSMFVNYVDSNASHSLVMFSMLQTDLISNSWQFQLLGQTPVPAPGPPGLQTINLPSGITLTPGTVLTLQNGQVSPHSGKESEKQTCNQQQFVADSPDRTNKL